MTIWEYSGTSRNKSVVTRYWFQEAICVLHSNACWPVVTEGVTMFLKYLLDIPLTPASQRLGKINLSRDIGNGRKRSDKTLSPYAKRLRLFAFVLAVACMARNSIAQIAKESIGVPPHSKRFIERICRCVWNSAHCALATTTVRQ